MIDFHWNELPSIAPPGSLELHTKLLRFFCDRLESTFLPTGPAFDLKLTTRAGSPAGAGLGGSSTLSVAIIGALNEWAQRMGLDHSKNLTSEEMIKIVSDIESRVIQVPAGLQDYYGAMYGGLQSLRWKVGSHDHVSLPEEILTGLEKRILLFYSGQSRNSGINNWTLFKNFIDRQEDVRLKFDKIAEATRNLEAAFQQRDWTAIGSAIHQEWEVRKTLAPGISTPEIEKAFAVAQSISPVAGKVCGAGGGGCFFLYLPVDDPDAHLSEFSAIVEALQTMGIRHLPFHCTKKGLEVSRDH